MLYLVLAQDVLRLRRKFCDYQDNVWSSCILAYAYTLYLFVVMFKSRYRLNMDNTNFRSFEITAVLIRHQSNIYIYIHTLKIHWNSLGKDCTLLYPLRLTFDCRLLPSSTALDRNHSDLWLLAHTKHTHKEVTVSILNFCYVHDNLLRQLSVASNLKLKQSYR
jgi:hypothetical protein